jgi:hypothetical protein
MTAADIGCSLAEAAEAPAYAEYLAAAAREDAPALHVVYINTSLRTKALAHAQVPTITCTSSNVVQTVLQVQSLCCNFTTCSPAFRLENLHPAQHGADCGACETKPALSAGGYTVSFVARLQVQAHPSIEVLSHALAVAQAFAQVPDIHVYYGPDTYMGRNLAVMLRSVAQLSDEEIAALHPAHNRASVQVKVATDKPGKGTAAAKI